MSMPMDLVLVRHGESEGNLAQYFSKLGDDTLWTEEFAARHTSKVASERARARESESYRASLTQWMDGWMMFD